MRHELARLSHRQRTGILHGSCPADSGRRVINSFPTDLQPDHRVVVPYRRHCGRHFVNGDFVLVLRDRGRRHTRMDRVAVEAKLAKPGSVCRRRRVADRRIDRTSVPHRSVA